MIPYFDELPAHAAAFAMDKSGDWYWYESVPIMCDYGWVSDDKYHNIRSSYYDKVLSAQRVNWRDTLFLRSNKSRNHERRKRIAARLSNE